MTPILPRSLFVATTLALTLAPESRGAILIQELFDNAGGGGNQTLNGQGDNASSVGFTGTWLTNGSTGINTANNFDGGTSAVPPLPGLSPSQGAPGGVWNGTRSWSTDIYATRPLAATIDFNVDQVLYFSVRLDNPADTSMGIGVAAGSAASATTEFIGTGLSWNNATAIGGANNEASNATYLSYGTLGTQSGPYGIREHEPAESVNGAALIVGRILISSTTADRIEVKRYGPGSTIEADPSLVGWSLTGTYDTAMRADHLLLWMNGGSAGGGQVDAIRFGTTWGDVTGVPEPGSAALVAFGALALLPRRRR